MALFKILKGQKANLPSSYNEGYCYVTTDEKKMYIDLSNSAAGRVCLNAAQADSLTCGDMGSPTQPVYFDNGVPVKTTYTLGKSVPSDAVFTDTDTKVTSVGNHYTPSANSSATLSADAANGTAATWNSTQLVTGVNLSRDAKGHVTGITVDSVKMPNNPNTDTGATSVTFSGSGNALTSASYNASTRTLTFTKGSFNNYTLPLATSSVRGGAKIGYSTSGKNYAVQLSNEQMFVNVPWSNTTYTFSNANATLAWDSAVTIATVGGTDITAKLPANPDTGATSVSFSGSGNALTGVDYNASTRTLTFTKSTLNNYTLPLATNSVRGGVKIGYSQSGKNYPVQLSNEQMFVNVPWSNTTYSVFGKATSTAAGTEGLVPAPAAGSQARYLRGDGTWATPTNTKYTAGTGLSLSGTTFNHTNSVTARTSATQSTSAPGYGGTFKVTEPLYDAQGHMTGISQATITFPPAQNIPTTLPNPEALTIGSKSYTGSSAVTITAADFGVAGAMMYKGITSTEITDGGTEAPTINNVSIAVANLQAGNVVLYGSKEFVWNGSKWELLGDEGSYKVKQTAVPSPSASGNATAFIDTISQDANGVITVTKKNVQTMGAATSAAAGKIGLVPAPGAGKQNSFLRGDGTWVVPTNTTYSAATSSASGLMTAAMVTKLNGIATGAEVNQNAFSNIVVGSTTISADSKTDSLTLVAGSNVTITPDEANDKITIAATDTTYGAATSSAAGLMSAADKAKLDGIAAGATANTGDITGVTAGNGLTGGGSSGSVTLNVGAGTGISVTADAVALATVSGLSAGTYGPSAAVTGSNNAKMNVPEITVDAYGRVTKITNREYTAQNTTYTSLKNPNSLTVQGNGTQSFTYDGSAAKTLNIKAGTNVSVSSDTSGNITINATDTKYGIATSTTAGLVKSGTDITVDADGNVSVNDNSHAHTIANITNLQTTLNGKVSLTGSTMTGNLIIKGSNPYVGFQNSEGTTKGYVQYIQSSDTYAFGAGSANSLTITNDGSIKIPANQTFTPGTTDTGSIGTSSAKWNAMYATTFNGDLSGNAATATTATTAATADKVKTSLAIKLNGGTTEGTNLFTFDGSAAKTVNITPGAIGAAPTNHASTATTYGIGSGSNYGHVKLSDSISSSNAAANGVAASPKAVYDAAALKAVANTFTGANTFANSVEFQDAIVLGADTYGSTLPTVNNSQGRLFFIEDHSAEVLGLPAGGEIGQTLVKAGTGDGDAAWASFDLAPVYNEDGVKSYLLAKQADSYSPSIINYDTSIYSENGIMFGAAWNDYAEYRAQSEYIEPGYCVASTNDGLVYKTTEKLQACDGIVSDTFGFAIGQIDNYQTPLAVAGRVLAYCEGDRNDYQAGDTVCAGPDGKVCKMTREEIREWPDRIIGIVSEIPQYENWGQGNIKVNDRIWIKVK